MGLMVVRSGSATVPGLATTERVPCNQCGSPESRVVAEWDRYGLPVRTVACQACGLRFISPRMTAEGYDEFYRAHYRPLLSRLMGCDYTPDMVRENSRKYAVVLTREVAKVVEPYPGSTLVDLGGGTGDVARAWAQRWGCATTVVDPSAEELACVEGDAICGTAETVDFPDRSIDVILLCRTIEHLLNPKGVLERARRWATDRGFLVVDAMDVTRWPDPYRYKVDHPYAFTANTFRRMVESAGWRIRGTWTRRRGQYLGLVCSPEGRT